MENDTIPATLCIGFRAVPGAGGTNRGRTLDMLQDTCFDWYEHVSIASDHGAGYEPFNRSVAKNTAAEKAMERSGDPHQILVFADADTYVPRSHVEMAVRAVAEGKCGVALAHNGQAVYLHSGVTRGLGENGVPMPFPGGIFAISALVFTEIGGFDPRFVGFGHEDLCFLLAADRIFGHTTGANSSLGPLYKVDLLHPRLNYEHQLAQSPETEEGQLYAKNTQRRDAYVALDAGDVAGYWKLREKDI